MDGGYNVDELSALFENQSGKTFVLISCEAGVGNGIEDSFAEKFAKNNKCRVFAPKGCSVFSSNGIAVIPTSKIDKYEEKQKNFEKEGRNAQVLNRMFDECWNDDNCYAVKWDTLNNYEQLRNYGFLEIYARD